MLLMESHIQILLYCRCDKEAHCYFPDWSSYSLFQTYDVGNPVTEETKVENHCAALCTAMEHSCSGFYIDSTEVPYHGSCHLVDETIDKEPTVGHGWRWLDVSWIMAAPRGFDCSP